MTPRDAATVAILRQNKAPEVLLLRRHGKSTFMANAWVYPGGQVDQADVFCGNDAYVASLPHDLMRLADSREVAVGLCLAAIRETIEEAGVVLGVPPAALGDQLDRVRAELHTHAVTLGKVAQTFDLRFDLEDLAFFAHWITPTFEPKRFDTRFFLAVVPEDQTARHDESETTDSRWMPPAHALDRAKAGEIMLAPPTIRTLEQLADFDTTDSAIAWAKHHHPPVITPHFCELEGSMTLVLPGDPLYPESDYPQATPVRDGITRMRMSGEFWQSITTNL
ncbi:MAG: NUDIX domain-containing protein [bacterium]